MYTEIKRACIVLTAIGVLVAGFFIVDVRLRQNKLSKIQSSSVVIPMDDLERLEPARYFAKPSGDKAEYNFVVLFDSSHCTSCALKNMAIWNGIIEKASEYGVNMDFLFIFSPSAEDVESFPSTFRFSRFIHPVYLDAGGMFLKSNPFLRRMPSLHSIVTDESGKIVFIGNPASDSDAYLRFESFLEEKGHSPETV